MNYRPNIKFERDGDDLENIIIVRGPDFDGDPPRESVIGHIIGIDGDGVRIYSNFPSGSPFSGDDYPDFQSAESAVLAMRNHWGVWYDSRKPVPGVIDTPESLFDLVYYGESIDAGYIWFLEESGIPFSYHNSRSGVSVQPEWDKLTEEQEQILESAECGDGDTTYYVGAFYWDSETELLDVIPPEQRDAETPDFAAVIYGGSGTSHIVWSRYVSRGTGCSPCYPGSALPDHSGDVLTYTLPPEDLDPYWQTESEREPERFLTLQVTIPNQIDGDAVPLIIPGDVIDLESGTVQRFDRESWGIWDNPEEQPIPEFLELCADLWNCYGDPRVGELVSMIGIFCTGEPGVRESMQKLTGTEYRFPM